MSQYSGFSLYFGLVVCTLIDGSCQICHGMVAFLCTLGLYYALIQFSKFSKLFPIFQIKAHQQEQVKTTERVLKDLLASQDKDTLQLLKEAAEQSEDEYSFPIVRT